MNSDGNPDLDENAPDSARVALIIIDMINDLEFPEGDRILGPAISAAENIASLKQRARAAKVPVIYANDNFGRWQSNFEEAVAHCIEQDVRGKPLAEQLKPAEDDYFVLKPKHSAFYATPLELLLDHLGARKLILCGISANMCVQFTAMDAYMRDFSLYVPADCTASNTEAENQRALNYMSAVLNADVSASANVPV